MNKHVGFLYFQGTQRLSGSLSTPVVSISTPSLSHQSLVYSSIGSPYNNGT